MSFILLLSSAMHSVIYRTLDIFHWPIEVTRVEHILLIIFLYYLILRSDVALYFRPFSKSRATFIISTRCDVVKQGTNSIGQLWLREWSIYVLLTFLSYLFFRSNVALNFRPFVLVRVEQHLLFACIHQSIKLGSFLGYPLRYLRRPQNLGPPHIN